MRDMMTGELHEDPDRDYVVHEPLNLGQWADTPKES